MTMRDVTAAYSRVWDLDSYRGPARLFVYLARMAAFWPGVIAEYATVTDMVRNVVTRARQEAMMAAGRSEAVVRRWYAVYVHRRG